MAGNSVSADATVAAAAAAGHTVDAHDAAMPAGVQLQHYYYQSLHVPGTHLRGRRSLAGCTSRRPETLAHLNLQLAPSATLLPDKGANDTD